MYNSRNFLFLKIIFVRKRLFSTIILLVCTFVTLLGTLHRKRDNAESPLQTKAISAANTHRETSRKWIVITSVSPVTEDIRRMASNLTSSGWRIVVIADAKTPPGWSHPNCTFLSLNQQSSLGYKTLDYLPLNSYARKAVGYLFAIQNGAQYIYDTDDDNLFLGNGNELQYFHFGPQPGARVTFARASDADSSEPVFFNPYKHFGRPDMWPRGYPLQWINNEQSVRYQLIKASKPAAIQQGLVEQDPDVDAIFRMVFYPRATETSTKAFFKFDPTSPAIALGHGVYAPFNSQNTLFSYNALWALVLPVSTTFRVCDIWRGYWALRLLWEIDETLEFYPANARQKRNPHTYFKDFLQEQQLYQDVLNLTYALDEWKCKNGSNFRACAVELANVMASKNFWSTRDVEVIEAWFEDLGNVGYQFPTVMSMHVPSDNETWKINYVSSYSKLPSSIEMKQFTSAAHLARFCQPVTLSQLSYSSFTSSGFEHAERTVLIIVFNHANHGNIPLLRRIYEPWFANVIFCSSFPTNFTSSTEFTYVSLSEYEMYHGYFSYACTARVIAMGMQNVAGYLVISDDVLLNFWTPFNASAVHLHQACDHVIENGKGWNWWNGTFGYRALEKIKDAVWSGSDDIVQGLPADVLSRLVDVLDVPLWCVSDIYYVPEKEADNFRMLADLFHKYDVFLEIAVPKILATIGWRDRYEQARRNTPVVSEDLRGAYLWTLKERGNPFVAYEANSHFLHPFKMSLLDQPAWKRQFCNYYIKAWFDALNRRPAVKHG